MVSSRLLYGETAAVLAQARRMDHLTDQEHQESLGLLDRLWAEVDVAEVDEPVVAATGDQRLLTAWTELGLAIFDTNATNDPAGETTRS